MEFYEFDLEERKLDELVISETYYKDNCFIRDKENNEKVYNKFILLKNNRSKTICELSFYKSSKTGKYLPRPVFKRTLLNDEDSFSKSEKNVNISFQRSNDALQFWKLVMFLESYRDLVELGEFDKKFNVVSKNSYFIEFEDKGEKEKINDVLELIKKTEIKSSDIKSITFEVRKQNIKAFYFLLKNQTLKNKKSHDWYRERYKIHRGEEYIWHHFLKSNDWILGLNVNLKFILDFIDEQKVGNEDSKGKGSPQTDLMGITDFTTLVELKHSNTEIFKKAKNKGRANTWDFTSDFIEAVSQCLGQKFELDKYFDSKDFIDDNNNILNKDGLNSLDPQTILVIGNKKKEFPTNEGNSENMIKNKTFQRFRRNNRNVDIITYDELFERAYHIVYSNKLSKDWYELEDDKLFK